MKRLIRYVAPIVFVVPAIVAVAHFLALDALAECHSSSPPTTLFIKIYYLECDGKAVDAKQPVPLNCNFRLDATAKAADRCLNDGSGNILWSVSPSNLAQDLHRGSSLFDPLYKPLGNGAITIQATLDGIVSNTLSVSLGSATGPAGESGSSGGGTGSASEEHVYCGFKNENNGYTCDFASLNDTKCAESEACLILPQIAPGNTCARIPLEKCSRDPSPPQGLIKLPPSLSVTPSTSLPPNLGLVGGLFNDALGILGIVVFGMLIYAGILRLLGAANPAYVATSKRIFTNAFLGGLLLLASYIILNAINPDFVRNTLNLPALPPPKQKEQSILDKIINSLPGQSTSPSTPSR